MSSSSRSTTAVGPVDTSTATAANTSTAAVVDATVVDISTDVVVDTSTAAIVDTSSAAAVDISTAAVVDTSATAVVDTSTAAVVSSDNIDAIRGVIAAIQSASDSVYSGDSSGQAMMTIIGQDETFDLNALCGLFGNGGAGAVEDEDKAENEETKIASDMDAAPQVGVGTGGKGLWGQPAQQSFGGKLKPCGMTSGGVDDPSSEDEGEGQGEDEGEDEGQDEGEGEGQDEGEGEGQDEGQDMDLGGSGLGLGKVNFNPLGLTNEDSEENENGSSDDELQILVKMAVSNQALNDSHTHWLNMLKDVDCTNKGKVFFKIGPVKDENDEACFGYLPFNTDTCGEFRIAENPSWHGGTDGERKREDARVWPRYQKRGNQVYVYWETRSVMIPDPDVMLSNKRNTKSNDNFGSTVFETWLTQWALVLARTRQGKKTFNKLSPADRTTELTKYKTAVLSNQAWRSMVVLFWVARHVCLSLGGKSLKKLTNIILQAVYEKMAEAVCFTQKFRAKQTPLRVEESVHDGISTLFSSPMTYSSSSSVTSSSSSPMTSSSSSSSTVTSSSSSSSTTSSSSSSTTIPVTYTMHAPTPRAPKPLVTGSSLRIKTLDLVLENQTKILSQLAAISTRLDNLETQKHPRKKRKRAVCSEDDDEEG